jgi:hypothetical protein
MHLKYSTDITNILTNYVWNVAYESTINKHGEVVNFGVVSEKPNVGKNMYAYLSNSFSQ